ncbi:MAG: hypothetical protein IJ461_09715 [Clostridia bacterium]|nr:hypothetical protein [Clostridia bacterium]
MQDYPWIKDQKAAMISVFLMAILAGAGMVQPLVAGIGVLALPLIGVMAWPMAGLASAFLGIALPQICLANLSAPLGLHLSAGGYAFALVGVSLWAFGKGPDFKKVLLAHWAAMALGVCLLLMGLRTVVGENLFTGCAQWVVDVISASANGDQILWRAYQSGLATAPGNMIVMPQASAYLQSYGLAGLSPLMTPALRHELAASLRTSLEQYLYAQGAGAIVAFIAGGGLLGVCWPACRMKRRGVKSPLVMPAFEKWHLPRGMGSGSAVLLLGYVIQLFASSYLELYWGGLLISAFQWIYMIQGAAYWEFAQKRMGGSIASRRVFVVMVGLFVPFLLVALGILDQQTDKRELREKQED